MITKDCIVAHVAGPEQCLLFFARSPCVLRVEDAADLLQGGVVAAVGVHQPRGRIHGLEELGRLLNLEPEELFCHSTKI